MNVRTFIQTEEIDETPLSGLAGFETAEVTNTIDAAKLPDAVVTGTTLLDLSRVHNPNVRSGITLSMLFASRVAGAKNLDNADEWLAEYQTALTQLGFALSGTARLNSRFSKTNVSVHKAIIPFLTIAFGGATVGPVILALLNNLDSMNEKSPWITFFDQQSKRFNVREMHFGAAVPSGTQTEIRYAVTRLNIDDTVGQVLFFKLNEASADFESLTTTMSADDSLMAVTEEDLRTRLSKLIKGFIWGANLGALETAGPAAVRHPGAPDPDDALAPILEAWHVEQLLQSSRKEPPVRFVASFEGRRPPDSELTATASARLRLPVSAGPLFSPDPDLDQFRLLQVDGVSRPDRADLFEVAAELRSALGATVVEPDLGSDYYCDERPPPDRPGPESADVAFWCWADPNRDKPADANWALAKTRIRKAWAWAEAANRPVQGKDIVVFQPDTGVVSAHAELPANIAHDPRAANFVEGSGAAEDPMRGGLNPGHGTGTGSVVASPIGGLMDGVAPLATLVPIRCVESVAVFDQSAVARAVDHARRNGAHVITMSLGGVPSQALNAALRRAVQENIIVVAAAGNCVDEVVWPARYSEAIAVGGVNETLRPWRGSSHGPAVAICAPAEFVLRANARDPQNPLSAVSGGQGTSFATALVAGIAALWLAYHGRAQLISILPPGRRLQDMFRSLLTKTAEMPPGHDVHEFGAGVVQAQALLASEPQLAFAANKLSAGPPDILAGLVSLVSRVFGRGAQEAVTPLLLSDPQHSAEIACAALDRARLAGTRRAYLESLPPVDLSPVLRHRLGPAAALLR